MSLEGVVYRITDARSFFTPIVLGSGPPTTGFEPWPEVTVAASLYGKLLFFVIDYENRLHFYYDGSISRRSANPV